ncbi:MAG: AsmA-like C-terminal region-containing protein [Candidatus Omnitrophica bacterium]|nr:AsmA-like C-terminal region-containing protein [Candidatus Omnitrophota bacterium]
MKKVLLILLFIAVAGVIGLVFSVQKYILPQLTAKLESALNENTPYAFRLTEPKISLASVIIPEITIDYHGKDIFIRNFKIKPDFSALFSKKLEVAGYGTVQIDDYEIGVHITDAVYNPANKSFLLTLDIPKGPIDNLIRILYKVQDLTIPAELININGLCQAEMFLKFEPEKPLLLKANLEAENLESGYQNIILALPKVSVDYVFENSKTSLAANIKNLSVFDSSQNKIIIKEGSIAAETDLNKIKIPEIKFLSNGTDWEGTAEISELKNYPTLTYSLSSSILNASGEVKKIFQTINFKSSLSKGSSRVNFKGDFDLKSKILKVSGTGKSDLKSVIGYLNLDENSKLKDLDSGIEAEKLEFQKDFTNNKTGASIFINLRNLSFAKHVIAESGNLDLRLENDTIIINKLYLEDATGSIQATGNMLLDKNNNFKTDIAITNYELQKLLKPFMAKDIGNALIYANASIKGALKNTDSILGVCKWEFKEGNLGRFTFLSNIASLINRSDLKEISFSQGRGTFNLKNNTLSSPESILISESVNLMIAGALHLKGNIDITVTTEFPQQSSEQQDASSSPFGKIGDILTRGVQELFYKVRITGSTENPKYTLIPASVDRVLQNLFTR